MEQMQLPEPWQEKAHPLASLKDISISLAYLDAMTQLLTTHGATLAETHDYPNPDLTQAYKEFLITFPEGTTRSFGLHMMRSQPFVIHFPDGYQLHGGELWPLNRTEDDTSITVLYLPQKPQPLSANQPKRSD